jgi:N-methylhydantoinase B
VDPREVLIVQPGARLTLETPGGGGFGAARI